MRLRIWNTFLLSVLTVVLTACGGGGGSDIQLEPDPKQKTGAVVLLFTDGPADDFDRIEVTIDSAELLGGPADVILFDGPETVDLLQLTDFADVFALSADVPIGTYSKIRLRVSDIALIKLDGNGDIAAEIHPPLPANGKIDLNPRMLFSVVENGTLIIEVDMDANKSIHIVQTGNGGYRFRPVVFVRIRSGFEAGKLIRLHGVIDSIDPDQQHLVLCAQAVVSSKEHNDHFDGNGCIQVNLLQETGIFDGNGDPVGVDALMAGDEATVVGRLQVAPEEDDALMALDGLVVELGPVGTFQHLDGIILSAVDADGQFDFELAPNQGFAQGSQVVAQVQNGTAIVNRQGDVLGTDAVQPDVEAMIDGILMLSMGMPDLLKTALIVLDQATEDAEQISGTVMTVDTSTGSLVLGTETGDVCVRTTDETGIFLVTSSSDGSTSEAIELGELASGLEADVFGEFATDGCFEADTIIAFDEL